jgi:glutathione S-transferase
MKIQQNDFNHCTLAISLRSPFARRVRIAFLEHSIPFQEKVYDVLKPNPEFFLLNPLGRVPALQLQNGQVLVDSNLILQSFYENTPSEVVPPPLSPDRQEMLYWSALFIGVMEKIVEYFLESQKPSSQQDPELELELQHILQRVFQKVEQKLSQQREQKAHTLLHFGLTQADFDLGITLTYLELRYPAWSDWAQFPHLQDFYSRITQRESFQKTKPPRA